MVKDKSEASLIAPVDKTLSLEARGVLAVMLNDPCCDYQPIENLYDMFSNDSHTVVKNALSELRKNGYIVITNLMLNTAMILLQPNTAMPSGKSAMKN